jgi:hypothetical protein
MPNPERTIPRWRPRGWSPPGQSDQTTRRGEAAERGHAIPRRRVSPVIENRTLPAASAKTVRLWGLRLSQIRTTSRQTRRGLGQVRREGHNTGCREAACKW